MSTLINELNTLCAEIRSDKVTSRTKAADRMDYLLTNSKEELITLYRNKNINIEVTWTELFNSAINGTLRHAAKIEESSDLKNIQTLRNKNHIYVAIVTKIIDYSVEDDNNFISKSTLLSGFFESYAKRSALISFGSLFLYILDTGIYKCNDKVCDLKVNEFSRIMSYLFEVNITNDDNMQLAVLRTINKTIELSSTHVQLITDLFDYFPTIKDYVTNATDDRRKAEVIKLYNLFVSQLSIDFHKEICSNVQDLLPLICKFYSFRMKIEAKESLFYSINITLNVIYPYVTNKNGYAIKVDVNDRWNKVIKTIGSIVDTEVKERKTQLYRLGDASNEKCFIIFIKMSAFITYLLHWHFDESLIDDDQPRKKVQKTADKMENILNILQPDGTTALNETWLAIFSELISTYNNIINIGNFQQILHTTYQMLCAFKTADHLKYIRICISSILRQEEIFLKTDIFPLHCKELWSGIVDFLKADASTNNVIIRTKQLLFQDLIVYEKCSLMDINALLETFIVNKVMRRSECMATIRCILIHANHYGLDKTSDLVCRTINWICETDCKLEAKSVLQGISPIDVNLLVDTAAIAVINFLNPTEKFESTNCETATNSRNTVLLLYKYNRQFICIEEYGREKKAKCDLIAKDVTKNCLFQSNYELLMRLLNFNNTNEITPNAISLDLKRLNTLACLMVKFMEYGVFEDCNYTQCPLIKRIGFYLSHLEFQLKSSEPKNVAGADLLEILTRIENLFLIFSSNQVLLCYLEAQPLDELITFVGNSLKHTTKIHMRGDFEDCLSSVNSCLKILATLCSSTSHFKDAFALFERHKFNLRSDLNDLMLLIKIFCAQRNVYHQVAAWITDTLIEVCRLFHNNIEFSVRIVELLPAIINYVQNQDASLQNMLIILSSFLKKAYKKCYSTKFSVNLINSIRLIVKNCAQICIQEDFRNICMSIAKFISCTSLELQFAAISTITALMDFDWFVAENYKFEDHSIFCVQLMSHINYKNLLTTTMDNKLNAVSLTTQLLISLFMFSTFHKDIALQELTYFCALRKLNKSNFFNFQQIALYYNCTLFELTQHYVFNLIHRWTERKYPITKFPYFLVADTKENFELQNIGTITSCLMMYSENDQLKHMLKYNTQKQLIEDALSILTAFTLPYQSGCANLKYSENIKCLIYNAELLGVDLLSNNDDSKNIDWRTICCTMELFSDDNHFEVMFGFKPCFQTHTWFNIDYETLMKCLNNYNKNYTAIKLIEKYSPILVKIFGELKEKTSNSIFDLDQLRNFHLYCTFAKFIYEAIAIDLNKESKYCRQFFVRDILYFVLHILQSAQVTKKVRSAALIFLQHLFDSSFISAGICNSVIVSHQNYIIRTLVSVTKTTTCSEIRKSIIILLHTIIYNNQDQFNESIALLDDLPSDENISIMREMKMTSTPEEFKNLDTLVTSFLNMQNNATGSLKAARNIIVTNKSQLHAKSQIMNDFIKRLVEIVRNPKEDITLALEAAKCLGEIGPTKMNGFLYFFEMETSFYDIKIMSMEPMEYFTQCLLSTIDKMLLAYKSKTFSIVYIIADQLVNSEYGIKLLDSFPYLNVFIVHGTKINSLSIKNEPSIDLRSILKKSDKCSYEMWICAFVSYIYNYFGWKEFEKLSLFDSIFAECSLIPLIKLLLFKKELHLSSILSMLDYFFEEVETAINSRTETEATIYKNKRVVKNILQICECIRIQNNWCLPIKLMNVISACNFCQAYFQSILYLEMASISTEISKNVIIGNEHYQDLSTKAYKSIGCSDAISGFLNPLHSRIEYLNIERNWSDVMLEVDACGMKNEKLYKDILKRNGLYSLANIHINNHTIDYESCWRLCQWDTAVEGHSRINTLNDIENEFEKHHFNALKCIYNREEVNSLAAITKARNCVLLILKEISIECLQNVYKYLTWLNMLQQAEDFCQVQFISSCVVADIFEKWTIQSNSQYGNFWCKEQVMAHKITLFKTAGVRAKRKIDEYFKETDPIELCLLKKIQDCKNAGETNLAIRHIATLKNMDISNEQIRVCALLEDADVSLKTGKSIITKAILHHVINNTKFAFCPQRVKAYRMQGEYLMESNTETFETVLQQYFQSSIQLLDQFAQNKEQIQTKTSNLFYLEPYNEFERTNRKSAYESIAKYADREYTQLNIYVNSEEFEMKCKIIQESRQAAESVGKQNKDRDMNICAIFMKKFANLDEKEIQSVNEKRTDFLCIAVENYIKFCKIDHNITSHAVYRIISLWFSNKPNESIQKIMVENVADVPTYKFLCVLNQMTARLNTKNKNFLLVLRNILVRCVKDHPHQTLYQLLPLIFAFTDSSNNKSNDRIIIARDIINKAKNQTNSSIIKQLECMFPALIEFANETLSENKLILNDKMRMLKNLNAIQCPTIDLPVAINKEYNITSIVKWNDKVTLVGGINAPKKLICICSDGRKREQLLKGKDDLRQDAVMQQVFGIINNLLQREPEIFECKLNLRTYKVVPLSMRSGIIEWCDNTTPIGVYLAGDNKNGAHKRYRPNDYTVNKCRSMSMQHLKSDAEKRLQMYLHICENIKPVFHYFFFEKFLVPGIWFERRLAYINSVATTSMVGFVLGLGDRHTQNILIDQETAEVIHIDFGIAFEQGKIMPTPETVPFRLTRDMVAPMGICETEGIFKKSCEATMRILRRNQAILTTILEVLLYDPLYIWKVVTHESHEKSHEKKNLTAQRALLCVQNKLEGKQAGIFGTSDIDVQVQRLINDAILNRNLCMLYPGWDPYL